MHVVGKALWRLFSQKITYIYQRLSVMLQGLRSHQIYDTLANYSSNRGGREVAVVGEEIQIEAERDISRYPHIELKKINILTD